MRPEDLNFWVNAKPFHPFRIIMNSGRTYEVRHPELIRVMRTSLIYFTPSNQEGVYDHAEMIGLLLADKIEPIDPTTTPTTDATTGDGH